MVFGRIYSSKAVKGLKKSILINYQNYYTTLVMTLGQPARASWRL